MFGCARWESDRDNDGKDGNFATRQLGVVTAHCQVKTPTTEEGDCGAPVVLISNLRVAPTPESPSCTPFLLPHPHARSVSEITAPATRTFVSAETIESLVILPCYLSPTTNLHPRTRLWSVYSRAYSGRLDGVRQSGYGSFPSMIVMVLQLASVLPLHA